MNNSSRTAKSLQNSSVALLFFVVQFLLSFYSRKIFLDYLGTEILGLNTTAVNILQFLNLSELGIGTAVGFSLYKPIKDRDENTINEIVTLQGHLYKRIASIIICGALVVMCFFPWIFEKMTLPLWYAYASFCVLLFSALLGYYVNYRQIVLVSSQMDYKVQFGFTSWNVIKVILQIVAVSQLQNPYVWWLFLEVAFAIIASVSLRIVTKKTLPFLRHSGHTYADLKLKYAIILTKIKQLFVHQIGAFALSQSSPLIIYAYASLSLVAIYGNYLIIINGLMRLVNAVFNSIGAGIGNLVAEGSIANELKVFHELYSIRFFISAVITYSLIALGNSFVSVWIGEAYLLPRLSVLLMSLTLFIRLNRATVNNFINAHGLYQDIWSPIVEASLNIGGSILLGYFFGLNGILAGVLISVIIIVDIWKPYMLFRQGFHVSPLRYFVMYGKHLIIAILAAIIVWLVPVKCVASGSWFNLICQAVIEVSLYSVVLGVLLVIFQTGLKQFVRRFFKIIKSHH